MKDINLDGKYRFLYLDDWCYRRFRSIDPSINPVKMRLLYGDIDNLEFTDSYKGGYELSCSSGYVEDEGCYLVDFMLMVPTVGYVGISKHNSWALTSEVFSYCSLNLDRLDGYTATTLYNNLTEKISKIALSATNNGILLYEDNKIKVHGINTQFIDGVVMDVGYVIIGVSDYEIKYIICFKSDLNKNTLEISDGGYKFKYYDGILHEFTLESNKVEFEVGNRKVTQNIFGITDGSKLNLIGR